MAIYKIAKSNYKAELYLNGQRQAYKRGFSTKSAAQQWLENTRIKLTKGRGDEDKNYIKVRQGIKLAEFLILFEEGHLKNRVKFNTAKRYDVDFRLKIIPKLGNLALSDLSPQLILNFQNQITSACPKNKKISAKTINHTMRVLSGMLQKAVEWGYLEKNPCKNILPLNETKKAYRWWTNEKIVLQFLTANKNHQYFYFFKVALETGLRLSELAGLTTDCIDWESGMITVSQQFNERSKTIEPLKNNSYRYVWLTEETLNQLKDFKKQTHSSIFLFNKENGQGPVSTTSVCNKVFRRAQKHAEVPIINFHGLRHTYASHFMMKGGKLYELKELLGHSSIKMTQKYAHLSKELLASNRDMVKFSVSIVGDS